MGQPAQHRQHVQTNPDNIIAGAEIEGAGALVLLAPCDILSSWHISKSIA